MGADNLDFGHYQCQAITSYINTNALNAPVVYSGRTSIIVTGKRERRGRRVESKMKYFRRSSCSHLLLVCRSLTNNSGVISQKYHILWPTLVSNTFIGFCFTFCPKIYICMFVLIVY